MEASTPPRFTHHKLLRTEAPWFALYFCLFLLIYGYSILRLGMHVDDVYDFSGEETGLYAAAGRWGVVLWRGIFGLGACVWAAGIISGVLISLCICLQTHLLRLSSWGQRLIFGGFYLGCIQFSHMLQFSFLCDAVAAAFLAATGAVMLLQRPGVPARLGSIALLTLAFGTYQATAFYFATLFLLTELRRHQLQQTAGQLRRVGLFILTGMAAAALWLLIKTATVHLPFVTQAQLTYVQGYQSSLTCWPEFLQASPAEKGRLFLQSLMVGYPGQWVCLSALIPFVILFRRLTRTAMWRERVTVALLLVLLCLTPYALGPLMLRGQTPWTLIAEPLMFAGLWGLLAASGVSFTPALRKAAFAILGFTLIKGLYHVSEQAKLQAHEYDICVAELRAMRSAAMAESARSGCSAQHIILIGEPMNRPATAHTSAEHTLTWSNMLYYYLRHLKLAERMHIGTNAFYKKHKEEFDTMPLWPAPGSVRSLGNDIIIKIGPQ